MSDEDRSMNLIGRGIGDRPVFKPPPKRSNDVKPPQVLDSSPTYEEEVRRWKRVEKSHKMCGYTLKNVNVRRKKKTQYAQRAKILEKMNPEGPQRPMSD
jgi:hypothetical protein